MKCVLKKAAFLIVICHFPSRRSHTYCYTIENKTKTKKISFTAGAIRGEKSLKA